MESPTLDAQSTCELCVERHCGWAVARACSQLDVLLLQRILRYFPSGEDRREGRVRRRKLLMENKRAVMRFSNEYLGSAFLAVNSLISEGIISIALSSLFTR